MRGKDGEKILDYCPRFPFLFFLQCLALFHKVVWGDSFIVLSMVVKGIGLKFEHVL